jgi:hypothetical protein
MRVAGWILPRIFDITGIQFMPINTLYQLIAMQQTNPALLGQAERFLMMADLFHYWLSGVQACELTNATTSQLYDPVSGDWASDLLERLRIRPSIFPEIVPPGTVWYATMTRLSVAGVLAAMRYQRFESRSYRISGSVTPEPFLAEVQKLFAVTLRAPRVPDLLKTLMRPLTCTRTWLGPTSPIGSGGMNPDCADVTATKLVPTV